MEEENKYYAEENNSYNNSEQQVDYYNNTANQSPYTIEDTIPNSINGDPQQQTEAKRTKNSQSNISRNQRIINFLRRRWKLVLITALLFITALGIGLFLVSREMNNVSVAVEDVQASIEGPDTLNSGETGEWIIRIKNNNQVTIDQVSVSLDFDRTFSFTGASNIQPQNIAGSQYLIAEITAGNETIISLEGVVVGDIDENSVMQGTITYQGNNQVLEQVLPTKTTTIKSPQVSVLITPSEQNSQNGDEVIINIEIENLSSEEIRDARLTMFYPDRGGFQYLGSELQLSSSSAAIIEPSDGNNIWQIPVIPRGEKQRLRVFGIVQGVDGVKQSFRAEVAVNDGQGRYRSIAQQTRDIIIASQPLIISTSIRGKEGSQTFESGERLVFEVKYENKSTETLKNVEIIASVEDPAEVIDYTTLVYVGGDIGEVNNRTIVWTANGVPELETVPPQSSGTLQYTASVKESEFILNVNLAQNKYILQPQVEAKARSQQPVKVTGEIYKARGLLAFEQTIEEIEADSQNAALRRFKVTWTLSTSQNKVNQVSVTTKTTFPPSVWIPSSIQPSANSNEIDYNPNNGEIIWSPGSIDSYTGNGNPIKSISFEMQVNEENRQNRDLYDVLEIRGVDDFTGEGYDITSASGVLR